MKMAQKLVIDTFRSSFRTIDKDVLHWFPGHMGRGLKQMQHKLRSVDCLIEVHDARVPFSGRNTDFKYKISGIKPHILVMNKMDLIPKKMIAQITEQLKQDFVNVVFTNCKNQHCKGVQTIFPLAQDLINKSDRYNRTAEEDFCVMIIGIPNVGKSSLVNTLRNRFLGKANATPVGAAPGITRSVMHKIKMCEKPLFYMLDTPGILNPTVPSTEVGLKLALCATIQDHLVGETIIADYLLYWLNKQKLFKYVEVFKLKKPTDDIVEVLPQIAVNENRFLRMRDTNNSYVIKPNFDWSAKYMIKAFRNGDLGKLMLDQDVLLSS